MRTGVKNLTGSRLPLLPAGDSLHLRKNRCGSDVRPIPILTKVIERNVQLSFPHRIFFTDAVFHPANLVLQQALHRAGESPGRDRKALMLVDDNVAAGQRGLVGSIAPWFEANGGSVRLAAPPLILPGGEDCKNNPRSVEQLWRAIHEAGIDRHSYVLAMGGGAFLDLAGYACATAHRGVRHIRMPATTLSQGDGGVGVKNGINWFRKKNWVGTFAVPWAVVNDFALLHSLAPEVRREGIIEAIKVALIRDAAFYHEMENGAEALAVLDAALLRRVVQRSAELHVEHICAGGDAFELGSARPLDFGHWAAHRLEPDTAFRLSHGRAVAIGMALDLTYAELAGLLSAQDAGRILRLISRAGFALYDPALSARDASGRYSVISGLEDFREHLGGELTITLVTAPGRAVEVHEMNPALIAAAIEKLEKLARTALLK